jgi:hypothetical protein
MKIKLVVAAAALALVTGCATVSGWFRSPTTAQYISDAVDVAVLVASTQGVSAAELHSVAALALAADNGAGATLVALGPLLQKEFARLNLPAADQAAANIFVAAVTAAIAAKIGSNTNVQQAQAIVADLLNDVLAATAPAQALKRGLRP